MAVNVKLTEHIKQFSACVTELDDKVMNGKETLAGLIVKLKAADKRDEDVAYGRDGLQARLQNSQRGKDKVDESTTRIQAELECFSARLKESQQYLAS